MTRRALPAAFAVAALLLAGCSSSPSNADAAACDLLHQYADDAVAAQPDAIHGLATDFGSVSGRGLSEDLEVQAVRVGGAAELALTGGTAADMAQMGRFVGQMREVCLSLGWDA